MKKRTIALLLACVMTLGVAIGGTLAWLIDDTTPVENTFTPSDIDIKLEETGADEKDNQWEKSYKMVPGDVLPKNPKVTVKAGSEACWLFVKVEETQNLDDFLTYKVITGENGWTELDATNHPGVYYRKVNAVAKETEDENLPSFPVIYYDRDNDNVCDEGEQDTVYVKHDVTKKMMNDLTADTYPKLTFTAYAIQQAHVGDDATKTEAVNALAAWNEIHSA